MPIFTKLLEAEETQEQLLAAKILTLIAFRCRDFVIQEPGCVTGKQDGGQCVMIVILCKQYNHLLIVVELNAVQPVLWNSFPFA